MQFCRLDELLAAPPFVLYPPAASLFEEAATPAGAIPPGSCNAIDDAEPEAIPSAGPRRRRSRLAAIVDDDTETPATTAAEATPTVAAQPPALDSSGARALPCGVGPSPLTTIFATGTSETGPPANTPAGPRSPSGEAASATPALPVVPLPQTSAESVERWPVSAATSYSPREATGEPATTPATLSRPATNAAGGKTATSTSPRRDHPPMQASPPGRRYALRRRASLPEGASCSPLSTTPEGLRGAEGHGAGDTKGGSDGGGVAGDKSIILIEDDDDDEAGDRGAEAEHRLRKRAASDAAFAGRRLRSRGKSRPTTSKAGAIGGSSEGAEKVAQVTVDTNSGSDGGDSDGSESGDGGESREDDDDDDSDDDDNDYDVDDDDNVAEGADKDADASEPSRNVDKRQRPSATRGCGQRGRPRTRGLEPAARDEQRATRSSRSVVISRWTISQVPPVLCGTPQATRRGLWRWLRRG